jgi:hypothetical protein
MFFPDKTSFHPSFGRVYIGFIGLNGCLFLRLSEKEYSDKVGLSQSEIMVLGTGIKDTDI